MASKTSGGEVAHGDRSEDRHVGKGKFLALSEALPGLGPGIKLAAVSSLAGIAPAGVVSGIVPTGHQ